MAEKLMLQAIKVKKQIIGSEISADIAYMYNELAVTYESSSHFDLALSCIKKQLSIFTALGQTVH
jgi:hypothetical protein